MSDDRRILDLILRALGVNPTSLRWRWRRRKQALSRWYRGFENRSRAARYRHKTCYSCGSPVDREEKQCPRCGATLSSATAHHLGRWLGLLVPEGAYVYTTLLSLIIVAVFGAMLAQGGTQMLWARSSEAVKQQILIALNLGAGHVGYLDPARVCHDLRLEGLGSMCPGAPHYHRLVTPIFVHFGILHLGFNLYVLTRLSPQMEEIYGRSRFLLLFLASGVGGNIVSMWWSWQNPGAVSAGASGALFGLMAAAVVYGRRSKTSFGNALSSEWLQLGVFAVVFSLLVGRVDHAAHAGGALTGAGLALVLPDRSSHSRVPTHVWFGLELLCLAIIVGSFVALFVMDDPVYALYRKTWFGG